ncbi:MAG TPA: nitrilase-related carbon-nitrogen hydrolase, partial [Gemmatimonadaceae bacterium]|nr:nitrilase-related carbon-nitrogen hydrolase [Gemmatimonadaceae bacterium]
MRDIRVATVQFQHRPADKAYNIGRVRNFVAEAAKDGVEIIAFPEMCITGYWHVRKLPREDVEALAESVPRGPSTRELLGMSREHRMTIGAGLIERGEDGKLYNAYVVAMPDGR